MTTATLTYATANVCEIPRHDKTIAADFAEVGAAVGHGVIMWQELGNGFYRKALAEKLPAPWAHYTPAPDFNDSPISYDTRAWTFVKGGAIEISPLEPGIERAKYVNYVILERAGTPGKRVAFTSRHYVARGFNPDGSNKPRRDKQEAAEQGKRAAIWHHQNRGDLAILHHFADGGYAQVVGGDYNRANFPAYPGPIAGHKVTRVQHGIDALYFIDSDAYAWSLAGEAVEVETHSDHKAIVQGATLKRRPKNNH